MRHSGQVMCAGAVKLDATEEGVQSQLWLSCAAQEAMRGVVWSFPTQATVAQVAVHCPAILHMPIVSGMGHRFPAGRSAASVLFLTRYCGLCLPVPSTFSSYNTRLDIKHVSSALCAMESGFDQVVNAVAIGC